jgi:ribosomal protein S21
MPTTKNPDYINWRNSQAKMIIMSDLEDGWLPMDDTKVSAEDAWKVYANLPEFHGICFKQFKERLADHRRAVEQKNMESIQEEDAFQHDCLLHPRDETHDRRGKLIFDRSPAKDLLRQDIKDGAYPRLSPMQLWNTRPEYKLFELKVFKERIYQEIRLAKFYNWCETKHQKKGKSAGRKRNYKFQH